LLMSCFTRRAISPAAISCCVRFTPSSSRCSPGRSATAATFIGRCKSNWRFEPTNRRPVHQHARHPATRGSAARRSTSKETTIKVTARLPDSQEPTVVFNSVEPVDVLPSSSINAAANIFVPLDVAFPHPLRFQILLGYKDVHGRAASREIPVIYDESQNYWTHGH